MRRAAPLLLKSVLVLVASGAAVPASAQPVLDFRDELAGDRPEAWAMRWFAAALVPAGGAAERAAARGSLEIAGEAGWLPELSERQRTVGFGGTKTEDLNRTPVYGRIWGSVGLGAGFTARVGWIPPVEAEGMSADLWTLAIARPLVERRRFRLGAALSLDRGAIEGDLTCDAASAHAGDDPVANPYRCEAPSEDELEIEVLGLELAVGWALDRNGLWEARLGLALRQLDAELRVDARYAGLIDRTVLAYDGAEHAVSAGLERRAGERARLLLTVVYAPLEVVRDPHGVGPADRDPLWNARLTAAWRLR